LKLETAAAVASSLRENANPRQAALLQRYFKTGVGEYGEADVFIGLKVPQVRLVSRQARWLSLTEIKKLIDSDVHEDRLCALLILTEQYQRFEPVEVKTRLFEAYLGFLHAGRINNWDLIDTSAPRMAAELLARSDAMQLLIYHAESASLWDRRFAMMATWPFLKSGNPTPTLQIAGKLLGDQHDLIHKATGWMLRELGKTYPQLLRDFLENQLRLMPRTTLRYAIEKFPEPERQGWLRR
jgi:3-methyladenine DNA glycosylase AlkD